MQSTIGFILVIFSVNALAADDLSYELSFGNHLELRNSGQEVTITARNNTEKQIDCMPFDLTDSEYSEDPEGRATLNSRLDFVPKDATSGCRAWCIPIALPSPFMVAGHIDGPLMPGEEKVCKYEVKINTEFTGTITLSGTNGPVFVTRIYPKIPVLSKIGICFLFILTLFLGIAHFRMRGLRHSGPER